MGSPTTRNACRPLESCDNHEFIRSRQRRRDHEQYSASRTTERGGQFVLLMDRDGRAVTDRTRCGWHGAGYGVGERCHGQPLVYSSRRFARKTSMSACMSAMRRN